MDLVIVIAGLASYVIVGLCVLSLFRVKLEFLPKSALAFGVGGSIVSFITFFYSSFGVQLSFLTVLFPWYLLFLYLLKKGRVIDVIHTNKEEFVFVDYFFIFLIVLSVGIIIAYTLIFPVSSWDAIATWSMLSKTFFYERSLGPEIYFFINAENPPNLILQQSFLSILLDKYNDREVMLLYPSYFISLLIIFYYFVKKSSTRTNALIFTFLLTSTPLLLGQAGRYNGGYVDLPLAYFILASILMLFTYISTHSSRIAVLLGFFAGILPLVKNEGLSVAVIIVLLGSYFAVKAGRIKEVLYITIGLLPVLLWKIYTVAEGFPIHPLYAGELVISRMPAILFGVVSEVVNISNWNLFWLTFILSLVLLVFNRNVKIVLLILLGQVIFYVFTYLYMPSDVVSQINSTLGRFLLQISPLALYLVASAFSKPAVYK